MRHLCCCVYAERAPAELEQEGAPYASPPCGGPGVSRQLTDWRLARRTTPGTSSAATSSADHPGLRLTPTSSTASRMLRAPPCSATRPPAHQRHPHARCWCPRARGREHSRARSRHHSADLCPHPDRGRRCCHVCARQAAGSSPRRRCCVEPPSSALASSTPGPSFGLIAADADLRGARVPAVAVARGVVRGSGQSERPEEGGWARQNWRTA